jgi:hypothetical protein
VGPVIELIFQLLLFTKYRGLRFLFRSVVSGMSKLASKSPEAYETFLSYSRVNK